ncbi:vWA domain-containing protein [Paracoccus laeviglucosivorans]|uniref:SS-A/Ro ribonucleoprotein n=1 Tax=Paracoccus laeviglucosivorans TaxID=1197861 RepID=A0A521DDZ1_9RHOB|nr:RNA-binding protein [Paracoccus laeviglucosivorans]SMO69808.1 SS-A/Ro ribonucleoprotein [Paracoccus laeviglucosivorans]
MANKSLFASLAGRLVQRATATNAAGAKAYAYGAEHKLAQLAMTGTFGGGFYQGAQAEVSALLDAAMAVDPVFLAQTAVHVREKGHMKDTPALLLAVLSARDPALFAQIFGRVVTSGKVLRGFVQILRSGQTGRKSLGSRPKAMVQRWLNAATDAQLLAASVGNDPSLADVIRMVHPRPETAERAAFYAWIIGRPADTAALPRVVQDLLAFRAGVSGVVPDVPFQMLADLALTSDQWADVARKGSWQMLRQGLNMLDRKGAFAQPGVVDHVAGVLRDPGRIRAAKALPYQLLATLNALSPDVDAKLRDALHDAMEISVANVPVLRGSVAVCPDVSGSMSSPVTGYRPGATSVVRCLDVAGLVAAAVLRSNPKARVLPFEVRVRQTRLEARDTILTNAAKLAALGGGGTNCSAPLAALNAAGLAPDLVIFVSDNQSWVDDRQGGQGTAMMAEWAKLKSCNPAAKLVCIDIQPYGTAQAAERNDVLNIGGFSDQVFDQIADFAAGRMGPDHWVGEIAAVEV